MPHFYDNLSDDISVQNMPHVKGITKDLVFFNHSVPEIAIPADGSHRNEFEVIFGLKLARYFLQQDYKAKQVRS